MSRRWAVGLVLLWPCGCAGVDERPDPLKILATSVLDALGQSADQALDRGTNKALHWGTGVSPREDGTRDAIDAEYR